VWVLFWDLLFSFSISLWKSIQFAVHTFMVCNILDMDMSVCEYVLPLKDTGLFLKAWGYYE
jgi:hypothetical protein